MDGGLHSSTGAEVRGQAPAPGPTQEPPLRETLISPPPPRKPPRQPRPPRRTGPRPPARRRPGRTSALMNPTSANFRSRAGGPGVRSSARDWARDSCPRLSPPRRFLPGDSGLSDSAQGTRRGRALRPPPAGSHHGGLRALTQNRPLPFSQPPGDPQGPGKAKRAGGQGARRRGRPWSAVTMPGRPCGHRRPPQQPRRAAASSCETLPAPRPTGPTPLTGSPSLPDRTHLSSAATASSP